MLSAIQPTIVRSTEVPDHDRDQDYDHGRLSFGMSNYPQYRQYSQGDEGQRGSPYPQQTSSYAAPSSMAAAGPSTGYPASTAPYSVPFYGAQQPSMTYGMQQPYLPQSQSYQGYSAPMGPPPSNYAYYEPPMHNYSAVPGSSQIPFPEYDQSMRPVLPPSSSPQFLHPADPASADRRVSRSTSLASNASSIPYRAQEEYSRSTSPSAQEMANWGFRNDQGTWSCAFPGCTSKSTFQRGCDLRKHYRRHTKTLFCRHAGCPQSTEGGFSSKKDRARHEAKHNPQIHCEWPNCDRLFSRVDNMKDHVRRIHKKDQAKAHS
ncbi:putative nucleic acid binding protein 24 [Elsinoe australis]|uniref:Putative nucleic acid binding protein 24 n=1 Tax=Elsinoe australis TaxID=40998 RepID=A0A4U7AU53_9PEZI|nr:putative nucleic acid binding protein 24 [Elsinoe australis]